MSVARGKSVAILAGVGALAVALLGAGFWRDIAVYSHLRRLRAEPKYLLEIVEKLEGTIEQMALGRYLREPEGAAALLSPLLESFELELRDGPGLTTLPGLNDLDRGLLGLRTDGMDFWTVWGDLQWGNAETHGGLLVVTTAEHHRRLLNLLRILKVFQAMWKDLSGQDLTLPAYPSLSFRIVPLEAAREICGNWDEPAEVPPKGDPKCLPFACLILRVPAHPAESALAR